VEGTLPRTIPARFGLIWLSGFRGEDLNVVFYQNMPKLHNRYKSELLPSLFVRPSTFHILIFFSETTGPIATKLWWNGPWMAPFQKCHMAGQVS
jgi:hypothetical protein